MHTDLPKLTLSQETVRTLTSSGKENEFCISAPPSCHTLPPVCPLVDPGKARQV